MTDRFKYSFQKAQEDNRSVLGVFVSAGDPDEEVSALILDRLVDEGADFIELGMPFSDPMADGPVIQASSMRAIKAGMTLEKTLTMAKNFRHKHPHIPLILMGYFNPIYIYGCARFIDDALASGVDGLIIVDLPPEEDAELCDQAREAGLAFIRLITPTTLEDGQGGRPENDHSKHDRLGFVLEKAGGFVYYVAVAGITGTKSADLHSISRAVKQIKNKSALPVVTGFGIKTAEQAQHVAAIADGVVVGSAFVSIIAASLDEASLDEPPLDEYGNYDKIKLVKDIGQFCATLSQAMKHKEAIG